jgi:hypothetical protein
VINWIIHLNSGRYCFLNNPRPAGNPFLTSRAVGSDLVGKGPRLSAFVMARLRACRKRLLIYNCEGYPISNMAGGGGGWMPERDIGTSGSRETVLVLRDAFNLFASLLRWSRGTRHQPDSARVQDLVEIWKEYAREYLGETDCVRAKTRINYNLWATDGKYRERLAESLGFEFTCGGTGSVPKIGPVVWGDTFDGIELDGRAEEMKITERWKFYAADPFYRSLFNDSELVGLSEKIFGKIPGTDKL